ncbi:MAG: hypothetical protein EOO60_11515 [Hymenobacter sp.]|nr:MAG: hypothetical protein EOO60_11515 [Hymenobacter sp.]
MPATNTLLAVALSFLLVSCHAKQATETTTSTATGPAARPDSIKYTQVPPATLRSRASATPGMQRWRINDTLTLECSHPLATFVTEEQPVPQPVWGQLALRGQHGWYKLLADKMYWTLYHVSIAPDGTLFQLPTVGVEDKLKQASQQVQQPLKLMEEDLFYNTYDVPHLTWTEYLDEDLAALPARQIAPEYLGGELDDKLYYPLPYWLAQEKKRLTSTRHLPTADRLAAYLELSHDTTSHTGRLLPPYKALLADLLHAYQAYPMAPDTLQLLQESLRSLNLSADRKTK